MNFCIVILVLFAVRTDGRLSSYQRYRISSLTGERIALPMPDQLEWQAQELGVLIHFNLATYIENHDACPQGLVPPTSQFNPYLLSTDNWVQTMMDFGAKYAVLVAKHNCGFLLSPTNVTFPLNPSSKIVPYNYTVDYSPVKGVNILDEFIKSCNKQKIRTGFYYSTVTNNYLNVRQGYVQNDTLKEGQLNITQQTYSNIVLSHLRELWTNYGNLEEICLAPGMQDAIAKMLVELQPHANVFGGIGITTNSIRWIGNEHGHAPDPTWSTGTSADGGDPDSPIFCPAECDTTLQMFDRWFWGRHVLLRSLQDLIDVYHRTVGRNCLLMLDLTPDRSGIIPPVYANRYKEFDDFIRSCYDTSVRPSFQNSSADFLTYTLVFNAPASVDRSVIQEDQTRGQVIRAYTVTALLAISKDQNEWIAVATGTSIGNKKIDLWAKGTLLVLAVKLNITKTIDVPVLKSFTVHLCA
ncbi:unnamed protein product [Adineta steineri]|uniref:alpha-L-fucosidase n=1 Tax=Adineta steineri TaxID=433720 RepID=A0A815QDY5_9BILA|nr:unnamed protein product [Adineta steineri]CAF1633421.1 unnamed protein product [Adineta steineri]